MGVVGTLEQVRAAGHHSACRETSPCIIQPPLSWTLRTPELDTNCREVRSLTIMEKATTRFLIEAFSVIVKLQTSRRFVYSSSGQMDTCKPALYSKATSRPVSVSSGCKRQSGFKLGHETVRSLDLDLAAGWEVVVAQSEQSFAIDNYLFSNIKKQKMICKAFQVYFP